MLSGVGKVDYQLSPWGFIAPSPAYPNPELRGPEIHFRPPFEVSGLGLHLWCKEVPHEGVISSPPPLQMGPRAWGVEGRGRHRLMARLLLQPRLRVGSEKSQGRGTQESFIETLPGAGRRAGRRGSF